MRIERRTNSAVQFNGPFQFGSLVRRYKRFLADILLENGKTLTVHCPNSGSMKGCAEEGSRVVISLSGNQKRKYPWTLEMVRVNDTWVGINTSLTNRLVQEAMEKNIINEFGPIDTIRREVRVSDNSRLDFLLQSGSNNIYIEVKNCTLLQGEAALFPDAVTTRGTRHLKELSRLREEGYGAGIIFCIQRGDAHSFSPAASIDPVYADTLRQVSENGVKVLAYQAEVNPGLIAITGKLPVRL